MPMIMDLNSWKAAIVSSTSVYEACNIQAVPMTASNAYWNCALTVDRIESKGLSSCRTVGLLGFTFWS